LPVKVVAVEFDDGIGGGAVDLNAIERRPKFDAVDMAGVCGTKQIGWVKDGLGGRRRIRRWGVGRGGLGGCKARQRENGQKNSG
jgi:hypothetical protein